MQIFNRHLLFVIIAGAMAVMTGCKNDPDDAPEPPADNPDTPQVITPTWDVPEYTVIESRKFNRPQMIDHALGSYGAMMSDAAISALRGFLNYYTSDNTVYHEDVIRYQSVNHAGAAVELSGIVSYTTSGSHAGAIDQLLIDSHATITDNASCPSEGGSIAQLLMLNTPTAVISADYQGYGIDRGSIHPYLNEQLTARQQIDLVKAAVDHLSGGSTGAILKDGLTTYSVGYSQGGAVALTVQRMLERDNADLTSAIGFAGSVCGDGPYNLDNTLQAYLRQGYVTIPVILPMMVRGMMESYPELFAGLTLSDFFTDEFLNAGGGIMRLLDQKELNVMEYNVLLGAPNPLTAKFELTDILKGEALIATSPQMTAMKAACARNNCILGWTPTHRVGFFHSKDDTVVPYDNLNDASTWPSDIYVINLPDRQGMGHLAGAMQFYTNLIIKGPAKMQ